MFLQAYKKGCYLDGVFQIRLDKRVIEREKKGKGDVVKCCIKAKKKSLVYRNDSSCFLIFYNLQADKLSQDNKTVGPY